MCKGLKSLRFQALVGWSECRDLNPGPLGPERRQGRIIRCYPVFSGITRSLRFFEVSGPEIRKALESLEIKSSSKF